MQWSAVFISCNWFHILPLNLWNKWMALNTMCEQYLYSRRALYTVECAFSKGRHKIVERTLQKLSLFRAGDH